MASRFWVGGTGTWDTSDTTHWAATTGGAGGQSVPGASDTVTFDASSGGGTVTAAATVTSITSLTMGAFTGTIDFSANNPNITMGSFSGTGTATRTINLGNGTWTINGTSGTVWDFATTTNLTFNANSSTIVFSAASPTGSRTFNTGSRTYNVITLSAATTPTATAAFGTSGGPTIATFNMTGPNNWTIGTGTFTITNGFNWDQASSAAPLFLNGGAGSTISSANNGSMSWAMLSAVTFSGGGTFSATNSNKVGPTTGITVTNPSASSGGARVIGG